MQSFEYSDEMNDSATMCGKQKEPESDFTELKALLIFLLLRQAMFKVGDRAMVLLLKFFKLFLSGIGKMMHAEVLINFAKIIPASYSVLFQLPYYDAIRFALIDPMHNLLLRSAKHVLKTWKWEF